VIGASSNVGTLVGFFLIAAVIVSPYGYWQVRKVRRRRAQLAGIAGLAAPLPADEPTPETSSDLAMAVADIAAGAAAQEPGAHFEVTLPVGATIGGRPAEAAIVETIVADGLRRDGIEIVGRDGVVWRCRKAAAPD
jgi:hypothetical protein